MIPIVNTSDSQATLAIAADRVSNALRIYAETSLRTKSLYAVDPEEAVDNLDRAFDGLLAGLHSLYDAMRKAKCALDWYAHGDTAASLVIRNARHHNLNGLFQSWNSLMLKQRGLRQMAGAAFLLVGYRLVAEEGQVSEYYVPWDDFRARFEMAIANPKQDVLRQPQRLAGLLHKECAFAAIGEQAAQKRYPANQVFINLVPIVMNAVTRAFAALREKGVEAQGYDSQVYFDHFAAEPIADLRRPTFKNIRPPSL